MPKVTDQVYLSDPRLLLDPMNAGVLEQIATGNADEAPGELRGAMKQVMKRVIVKHDPELNTPWVLSDGTYHTQHAEAEFSSDFDEAARVLVSKLDELRDLLEDVASNMEAVTAPEEADEEDE